VLGGGFSLGVAHSCGVAEHLDRGLREAQAHVCSAYTASIVVSDPIGALAHVQLGRACALSGDQNKAKAAYQDFLKLWKDADPDIPILRQAKAEYAKLQ
jgi:hypothetical protein